MESLRIVRSERGEGRSTLLCDWLTDSPDERMVIVDTHRERSVVYGQYVKDHWPAGQQPPWSAMAPWVVTLNEFTDGYRYRVRHREVAIDDIERVLAGMLHGTKLSFVTAGVPVETIPITSAWEYLDVVRWKALP